MDLRPATARKRRRLERLDVALRTDAAVWESTLIDDVPGRSYVLDVVLGPDCEGVPAQVLRTVADHGCDVIDVSFQGDESGGHPTMWVVV